MGPRKLAPKLPANSLSASSGGYALDSNPQSQSQSQEPQPQPNAIPTKPKRAQVRAACVACQRGKAKVSQMTADVGKHVVT